MSAHLVGAETVQVGGKARLRLEACGGEGRSGQACCAGAEGTREVFERQLGGCLGRGCPEARRGEAVATWETAVRGRSWCLWRGCLAGKNRGAGQDQVDIVYAIRSGDDCGTLGGPRGCLLHLGICQDGEAGVDREIQPGSTRCRYAPGLTDFPWQSMSGCRQFTT